MDDYEEIRQDHYAGLDDKRMVPFDKAKQNKVQVDFSKIVCAPAQGTGVRVMEYAVADLLPFIDWVPFFAVFELHGRYPNRGFPNIFKDDVVGPEAKKLYDEAQQMLQDIASGKIPLTAKAIVGIFPANSTGEDVELYEDDSRKQVKAKLCMLRQQIEKESDDEKHASLADFIAPAPHKDHIGMFACSVFGAEEMAKKYEAGLDDFNKILVSAIADRLAEAMAEKVHLDMRKSIWGFVPKEELSVQDLLKTKHQGIRPAPGYPSQCDHTEKLTMWSLMDVEKKIGTQLTDSLAMRPAASVSALVLAHPDAHYFAVGAVDKDQVVDYAKRKNMPVDKVEKNLAQILSYAK
jgi:5-methyltetrahydrofolate--homocysteine methyltransferase